MATQIDAARLLVRRAAFNHDVGLPFTKEAAMAKLYASEVKVPAIAGLCPATTARLTRPCSSFGGLTK